MLSKLAQSFCMASRQLRRLSDHSHPLYKDSSVKLVEEIQQLNQQMRIINAELNEAKTNITNKLFWMDFHLTIIALSGMVVAVKV